MTRIENLKKVIEIAEKADGTLELYDVRHLLEKLEKEEAKKEEKRKARVEIFNHICEILKGDTEGATAPAITEALNNRGVEAEIGKVRYALREGVQGGFLVRGSDESKHTTYRLV